MNCLQEAKSGTPKVLGDTLRNNPQNVVANLNESMRMFLTKRHALFGVRFIHFHMFSSSYHCSKNHQNNWFALSSWTPDIQCRFILIIEQIWNKMVVWFIQNELVKKYAEASTYSAFKQCADLQFSPPFPFIIPNCFGFAKNSPFIDDFNHK